MEFAQNGSMRAILEIAARPISRRLVVAAGIVSVVTIAWAKNYGPYHMKMFHPTVTYSYDMETTFAYAGKLPRDYLNRGVDAIKKGDRVRIVYPDGAVFDFETLSQCSPERSIACAMDNPVRVSNIDAPAKPTAYDLAYMREDTCPWDSGYKNIPTGYWANKTEQTGVNEFTQSAWYVSTGTVQVYIKGSGCK